jgi:hypothetical protein
MFHVLGPLLENAKHVPAVIEMRQGTVQNNRRLVSSRASTLSTM